jgi:two-component system response regulator DesR
MTIVPVSPTTIATRRLHVLIVDGHEVVQWGLRTMLTTCSWVAECAVAGSADEAQAVAQRLKPDIAVIEAFVGPESGVDISRALVDAHPRVRVLLLVSDTIGPSTATARAAGASGFISKSLSADDLVRAIRLVGIGRTAFHSRATAETAISAREFDVLKLIALGWTNCEIAETLFLSPNTVKQHARNLYLKLKARNRAQAVARARAAGLLD